MKFSELVRIRKKYNLSCDKFGALLKEVTGKGSGRLVRYFESGEKPPGERFLQAYRVIDHYGVDRPRMIFDRELIYIKKKVKDILQETQMTIYSDMSIILEVMTPTWNMANRNAKTTLHNPKGKKS